MSEIGNWSIVTTLYDVGCV